MHKELKVALTQIEKSTGIIGQWWFLHCWSGRGTER
jgi:hypothetical protein